MSQPEHESRGETPVFTAQLSRELAASLTLGPLALVVFGGDNVSTPERHALAHPLRMGRDEACGVRLDDEAVSREHAELTPTSGGLEVEDLQSRNGTFVGGRRIERARAQAGALLRFGNTLCRLVSAADSPDLGPDVTGLVGGASLAATRRTVSLVGPTDLRVLILGESGTGKELVARGLAAASPRRGPFVPLNCAALPEALAESELFGHERGAFTGADRQRRGLFQTASGGTLLLDEIGELGPALQAKLLRVLEDGEVRPVGGERYEKVDVRVIAATNRDLVRRTAEGSFRPDLLARLAEVEVRLPPLRDHVEDLPVLIEHLLRRANVAPRSMDADCMEALALYDWPLNVRELDNVMRAAVLTVRERMTPVDLPERIRELWRRRRAAPRSYESGDLRDRIEAALDLHRGNVRRVGQELGIGRGQLYRLFQRWNLDVEAFRSGTSIATTPGDHGHGA